MFQMIWETFLLQSLINIASFLFTAEIFWKITMASDDDGNRNSSNFWYCSQIYRAILTWYLLNIYYNLLNVELLFKKIISGTHYVVKYKSQKNENILVLISQISCSVSRSSRKAWRTWLRKPNIWYPIFWIFITCYLTLKKNLSVWIIKSNKS